jgi:hypothetical protein
VKEEVDVDMNGSLMRSRKLFWAMLSIVQVLDLVGNGAGRRRARDPGEGRWDILVKGCFPLLSGFYLEKLREYRFAPAFPLIPPDTSFTRSGIFRRQER